MPDNNPIAFVRPATKATKTVTIYGYDIDGNTSIETVEVPSGNGPIWIDEASDLTGDEWGFLDDYTKKEPLE